MDKEGILAWVRSFDGVTPENCPDFDSLRDGIVLGIIFNHLNGTPVEFQARELDKTKDDWVTALRNLRDLQAKVKPAFDAAKVTLRMDAAAAARPSAGREEALAELVESFVVFALKCPKKAEVIQKIKTLPKEGQRAIKAIVEKVKAGAVARPTTPTKESAPASPPQPQASRAVTLLERQIALAKREKEKLAEQREQLEKEKQEALAAHANVEKCPEQIEYEEACAKHASLEKRAREIEEQVKAREGVLEDKKRAQSELDAINTRISELKGKLSMTTPTVESFRQSTDETAQTYLKEIDEAEKRLTNEYSESLKNENQNIRNAAKKLSRDIKALTEIVGDVEDETDGESRLQNEIEELVERTKALDEEVNKIVARTEAIERMKQQKSFLEHLRSSTKYIKPE